MDLNSKSGVDNASVIDSLLRSQITSDPRYPTFFFLVGSGESNWIRVLMFLGITGAMWPRRRRHIGEHRLPGQLVKQ